MADTKCYMIVVAALTDREKFMAGYAKAVPPLIESFGGRYVLMGAGAELLEGSFADGASLVISEWPDRAAAKAFWTSQAYQEAKKLREGTGQFNVLLIDAPQMNA